MSFNDYLKRKFVNYEFATKLWFLPGEELQIEAEILKLISTHAETKEAIQSDTENSRGEVDYFKVCFLREIWVAEIGASLSYEGTEEVIMKLMEGAEKLEGIVAEVEWANDGTPTLWVGGEAHLAKLHRPRYLTLAGKRCASVQRTVICRRRCPQSPEKRGHWWRASPQSGATDIHSLRHVW